MGGLGGVGIRGCMCAWRMEARPWRHGREHVAARRLHPISALPSLTPSSSCKQIRVHAKHIGHPLLADDTYSSAAAAGSIVGAGKPPRAAAALAAVKALARPALHAKTLGFAHPATGEQLEFDSALPPDLEQAIAALRGPPFA